MIDVCQRHGIVLKWFDTPHYLNEAGVNLASSFSPSSIGWIFIDHHPVVPDTARTMGTGERGQGHQSGVASAQLPRGESAGMARTGIDHRHSPPPRNYRGVINCYAYCDGDTMIRVALTATIACAAFQRVRE